MAPLWEGTGKPGGKRGVAREADAGDETSADQGWEKSRPEKRGREKYAAADGCRLALTTDTGAVVGGADEDGEAAEEDAGIGCVKEAATAEVGEKESMARKEKHVKEI